MKCKHYNATISTKTCIKRQQLLLKSVMEGEDELRCKLITNKCINCRTGRIVKKFPFKRFDNDLKRLKLKVIDNANGIPTPINRSDFEWLIQKGVFYEINLKILHPMGFHLSTKSKKFTILKTTKEEGFVLKDINKELIEQFVKTMSCKAKVRFKNLHFVVQDRDLLKFELLKGD